MAAFHFRDAAAEQYFRKWVGQLQQSRPSIETLRRIAPPELEPQLITQYQAGAEWSALIKEISLYIIIQAGDPIEVGNLVKLRARFGPASRGPPPTLRIRGSELKYKTAPPIEGPLRRTFMISGQGGLDHGPLRFSLEQLGFQEIVLNHNSASVGLFLLEQAYNYDPRERLRYDPRSSGVICNLKNLLPREKECVTNKSNLYFNLKAIDPALTAQYLAPTSSLRSLDAVPSGQVLIIKPVGPNAGGGAGIEIVTTSAELRRARERLLKNYPDGLVSQYILDPLLLDGKKLHLRMYFLVRGPIICDRCQSTDPECPVCQGRPGEGPQFELFERGKILTASQPYQNRNFKDPTIHDTHVKSTAANYYFPDDLIRCHGLDGVPVEDAATLGQDLLTQMHKILGVAAGVMVSQIKTWHYPESNFGYEIFGCDFMVRSSGSHRSVVLLEINDKVGNKPCTSGNEVKNWPPPEGPGIYAWDLSSYRASPYYPSLQSQANFSRLYWEWVLARAILPFYAHFEVDMD
jgi:hypothetical protein